jgi:hypothetical protein
MLTRILSLLAATALVATVAAGCGGSSSGSGTAASSAKEVNPAGDIPDNQAYVAYTPPGGGYSVKVPEGWARTASNGAVTFTDKLNSITMERGAGRGPVTVAAVKRSDVPALAKTVRGFSQPTVSSVQRTAGPGVRVTYLAAAKPDPVTGKRRIDAVERYVFAHNGRRVVLTLSGPKGADNVDPWKIVTDSLRFAP